MEEDSQQTRQEEELGRSWGTVMDRRYLKGDWPEVYPAVQECPKFRSSTVVMEEGCRSLPARASEVRKGPLRFLAGTKDDPSVHLRLVEEVLLRASERMPEASQGVVLNMEDLSEDLMANSSWVVADKVTIIKVMHCWVRRLEYIVGAVAQQEAERKEVIV